MDLSELTQIKEKELASRKKYTLRCCMAAGCVSSNAEPVKKESPAKKPEFRIGISIRI